MQRMAGNIDKGEPIFVFEVCRDCKKHSTYTRHKEEKYQAYFDEMKAAILSEYPQGQVMLNDKPKEWPQMKGERSSRNYENANRLLPRLGAFEISALVDNQRILLFSKLKSMVWPDSRLMMSTIKRLVEKANWIATCDIFEKF